MALVEHGMVVGLGTGSTAVRHRGRSAGCGNGSADGAIATSERSAAQARAGGIPMATLRRDTPIDI